MAFEIPGFKLGTQVANADLADRYRFVTINSSGKIAQVGTAGAKAAGVLQSPALADKAAEVMVSGVSKVEAGAAIAAQGNVTSDATGRAIAASTATHSINGVALETAAAAGEVIAVLIGYGGVVPA
jgi:hypothetical protein